MEGVLLYYCFFPCGQFRSNAEENQQDVPERSFEAPFGDFDPRVVHERLREDDTDFAEYVNPLMTSMTCLNPDLFERPDRAVRGTDILDMDPGKNPDFYAHNHVVIPYCSSDLWLASDVQEDINCDCGDLDCFDYEPDSSRLQFAFRGKLIFQAIFEQLLGEFGMSGADEILLAGSSAGGVGVANLAQWAHERMPVRAELLLVLDSAWFINFQDGIFRVFDGTISSSEGEEEEGGNSTRLFDILSGHPACEDTSLGFPCCISAHCLMTSRNETDGELLYFPESGQRTFVWSSVYDIFLLAPSVAGLESFQRQEEKEDENMPATSLIIDFLRVVGEYGGEMNFTLAQVYRKVRGGREGGREGGGGGGWEGGKEGGREGGREGGGEEGGEGGRVCGVGSVGRGS